MAFSLGEAQCTYSNGVLLSDVCVAARRKLETIMEEEEAPKVVAPRFVPMLDGLEAYLNNKPVLTAFQDAIYERTGLIRGAVVLDLTV